jgi:hypothetical protein
MVAVVSPAALSAAVEPAPSSALDPILDPDSVSTLPAFPLNLLPQDWRQWVADSAARVGAPTDHVALGLLGAVAGVTGAGVMIQPIPGWREPLVLWQCAVGPSSRSRSAALGAGRALIEAIEDDDEEAQAARQRIVGEGTLRTVAKVVSRNTSGVVVWRDELAAWLPRGPKPRAAWQEAWSAEPLVINSGSEAKRLRLKRFAVSVMGGLGPELLAPCLKGHDDGFAARFLYAWPAATAWCPLGERPRVDDTAAGWRFGLIARQYAGTAAEPLVLEFEPEAVAAFEGFCAKRHAATGEGTLAAWQRKGPGTVARLAAVLRLLEWSESRAPLVPWSSIGGMHVEAAIALWEDYFRPHAEAVLRHVTRGRSDDAARRVVAWLKDKGMSSVSSEDIRVSALSRTVDARGAARVIARLEEAGILVREAQGRRGVGRPPARRWHVKTSSVNPGNSAPLTAKHNQANQEQGRMAAAKSASVNSDDPDRFRRAPPPGFDLYAVLSAPETASVNSENTGARAAGPEPACPEPAEGSGPPHERGDPRSREKTTSGKTTKSEPMTEAELDARKRREFEAWIKQCGSEFIKWMD